MNWYDHWNISTYQYTQTRVAYLAYSHWKCNQIIKFSAGPWCKTPQGIINSKRRLTVFRQMPRTITKHALMETSSAHAIYWFEAPQGSRVWMHGITHISYDKFMFCNKLLWKKAKQTWYTTGNREPVLITGSACSYQVFHAISHMKLKLSG